MKNKLIKGIVALIVVTIIASMTAAYAEVYLGRMSDYGYKNACGIFSAVNCINSLNLTQVDLADAIPTAEQVG